MDNAYELVTGDGLNNGYLYFVEPLRRLLSHCGENGDVYVLSHGSEIDLCLIVIDDRAEGCEGQRVGYVTEMYTENVPGGTDFDTTDISMWLAGVEQVDRDVLLDVAPLIKERLGINIRDENNDIVEVE